MKATVMTRSLATNSGARILAAPGVWDASIALALPVLLREVEAGESVADVSWL